MFSKHFYLVWFTPDKCASNNSKDIIFKIPYKRTPKVADSQILLNVNYWFIIFWDKILVRCFVLSIVLSCIISAY